MKHFLQILTGGAAIAAVLLIGGNTTKVNGQPRRPTNGVDPRVQIGLAIAPVPLNLQGKDVDSVGLGSYLVNVVSGCNDCHTQSPTSAFAAGRNPYFGQPKQIDPKTYLVGGRSFGSLVPNSPAIITRNLTPDKTGTTGGHTFAEFYQILTTGVDLDQAHPACSSTVTTNCLPAPFNGSLLQVMPWPSLQNLTIEDIRAIYDYLNSIPCLEGGPGEPANRCK